VSSLELNFSPNLVLVITLGGTLLALFHRGMFKRTPLACVVAAQEKKSGAFLKITLSTCPKNRAERVEYTVNLP